MKLAARPLVEVTGVNAWRPATEVQASLGDPVDFYFQLMDNERTGGIWMGQDVRGLRYMPVAGSTLLVTFINIDSAKQFARAAAQPFPLDTSIWRVQLVPGDAANLSATVSLKLQLTEPGPVVRTAYMQAVLLLSAAEDIC